MNQRDKMSYFYDSYDTYDYDSTATVTNYGCKCRLCHIVNSSTPRHHTAAPHTRTDGHRNRPVIQSLSVNIATEEDTEKAYKDTTYINLIPGLWMDVSSVTSVY